MALWFGLAGKNCVPLFHIFALSLLPWTLFLRLYFLAWRCQSRSHEQKQSSVCSFHGDQLTQFFPTPLSPFHEWRGVIVWIYVTSYRVKYRNAENLRIVEISVCKYLLHNLLRFLDLYTSRLDIQWQFRLKLRRTCLATCIHPDTHAGSISFRSLAKIARWNSGTVYQKCFCNPITSLYTST